MELLLLPILHFYQKIIQWEDRMRRFFWLISVPTGKLNGNAFYVNLPFKGRISLKYSELASEPFLAISNFYLNFRAILFFYSFRVRGGKLKKTLPPFLWTNFLEILKMNLEILKC